MWLFHSKYHLKLLTLTGIVGCFQRKKINANFNVESYGDYTTQPKTKAWKKPESLMFSVTLLLYSTLPNAWKTVRTLSRHPNGSCLFEDKENSKSSEPCFLSRSVETFLRLELANEFVSPPGSQVDAIGFWPRQRNCKQCIACLISPPQLSAIKDNVADDATHFSATTILLRTFLIALAVIGLNVICKTQQQWYFSLNFWKVQKLGLIKTPQHPKFLFIWIFFRCPYAFIILPSLPCLTTKREEKQINLPHNC